MKQTKWYSLDIGDASATLKTDVLTGLKPKEAIKRLSQNGYNEIEEKKKHSPIIVFLQQFNDVLVWVLIAAALISGLILGEFVDALVIGIILIFIAILGFIQHFRAEKSLEALKALSAPSATVIRQKEREIKARNLVVGDIILLEAGDKVPADARLIKAASLQVQESSLTGESQPVSKHTQTIKDNNLPLAEQKNMVFAGTIITRGRGRALVTETGPNTSMGEIASLIETHDELTPLQKELKNIGFKIATAVTLIAIIVFIVGFLKGNPAAQMFLTAVALAVAAIPEGLPAVVTITLAIGVQYMAKQNAIVRRLHSVETLGSTNFIATDKTGTLTLNKMTVVRIFLEDKFFTVKNKKLLVKDKENKPDNLDKLMIAAVLVNDSRRIENKKYTGEPTELALINISSKFGYDKKTIDNLYKRVDEIPFESKRKEMTTVHKSGRHYIAYTKGAVEVILKQADFIQRKGGVKPLNKEEKENLLRIADKEAADGHRLLGFAYCRFDKHPKTEELEKKLTFIGMMGLLDPPRAEVPKAIKLARRAGIKIAMVTGDHLLTAKKIASEIGLDGKRGGLTGKKLQEISSHQLAAKIDDVSVFARVDPVHKVKIVEALKEKGYIVAVTGDGVNDAPALKKADIGIAMGITGTDVSKEASDVTLADDNFATIVHAIKQGRKIYDNLRKFISFLLSANISEVLTIFIGILIAPTGITIVLPIQILWINLVTDALPALALGVDPEDPRVMNRTPRKKEERILNSKQGGRILLEGLLLTAAALTIFIQAVFIFKIPEIKMQTMVFTTLVLIQLIHAFNYRSFDTIFSKETFKNRYLLLAFVGSFALQLAVIYIPFLKPFFHTIALNMVDWFTIIIVSFTSEVLIDISKITLFKKSRKSLEDT